MNTTFIDITVGAVIFAGGLTLTIRRFGTQNRLAYAIVAILTPLIAVVAVLRVFYLSAKGQVKMEPCPVGLERAEMLVERERQAMFGGPLRQPLFTASWKIAYERELEKDTERVQRIAQRYLSVA
jgi:hypothetical protein